MEEKHTIEYPLILKWDGNNYKVNKPNQGTQELVSKEFVEEYVMEQKKKLLESLILSLKIDVEIVEGFWVDSFDTGRQKQIEYTINKLQGIIKGLNEEEKWNEVK